MNADQLMDKLKILAETSTVEEFRSRLEAFTLLYAYMEKRFEQRFPKEFQDWVKEHGE